jgi:hypothetical protein
MKKPLMLATVLLLFVTVPVMSQGLLNKVKKAVSKEILEITGDDSGSASAKAGAEPACACDDAVFLIDLGKYKLDYKETSVSMKDDGSILVRDKIGGKYYIVSNGTTEGPLGQDDARIRGFESIDGEDTENYKDDEWVARYPAYISRSGEKYLIRFGGKNYGPYALISDFAVSRSKDKFAAIVTENILMSESEGKKLEEAMNNAKTDQERMDLAMKMSQQMQNQMQAGGAESIQPKAVSNIPGATYDMMTWMGGRLNNRIKIDDILVKAHDRILDLKGNTVMKLNQNDSNAGEVFVSSANDRYASYIYGTLTFSDNTKLTELFNPFLSGKDGKAYLNYMYYSPGKNAIMQCFLPF